MTHNRDVFSALNSPSGTYNEALSMKGATKDYWQPLFDEIGAMNEAELTGCAEKARRLLRDDGATFQREGSQQIDNKSWPLDPIPRLIAEQEWKEVETALALRSQTFNALLKDLYTDRLIIKEGIIPPEAVFSHKGFLRACQDVQINALSGLFLHCVDMMRNDHGQWVILNDAFQIPKGIGYTLENRTVVSRLFPKAFQQSNVKKLNSFYHHFWGALSNLSDNHTQNHVVILSKGPNDASYFEQSFLANLLGVPLVQSLDLLVRNNKLWMKTFDGLQQISIIFRYIEDELCDPVELKGDSYFGVSGLLQAVRAKHVIVVNPIGSSILENPILYKYLPAISQFYTGNSLAIPSVPTYWYHDKNDRDYITQNIEKLVIKPAFASGRIKGVWGADLDKKNQTLLINRMINQPFFYVAQEQLRASQTPAFIDNKLQSQPSTFRTFTLFSKEKPILLEGGLAQVSQQADTRFIRLRSEALSKDIWVLGNDNKIEPDYVQPMNIINSHAQITSLPSRAIENLYFFGRYAERAEITLRLIRTYFLMMSSEEGISENAQNRLITCMASLANKKMDIDANTQKILDPDGEIIKIINSENLQGSISATLTALLDAAEASKELLSIDTIRITNNLHDSLSHLKMSLKEPLTALSHQLLEPLITDLLALSGITHEHIRDTGWHFILIGKRIEKFECMGKMLCSLFVNHAPVNDQDNLLKAFLLSLELYITFRREYKNEGDLQALIEMMLFNTRNPHALLFQVGSLHKYMNRLPHSDPTQQKLTTDARILLEIYSSLKLVKVNDLLQGEGLTRTHLADFLKKHLYLINALNDYINDRYFDHSLYPRQLIRSNEADA